MCCRGDREAHIFNSSDVACEQWSIVTLQVGLGAGEGGHQHACAFMCVSACTL